MKKIALGLVGILVALVLVGAVMGKAVSNGSVEAAIIKQAKISMDEARKIALKKVEGSVVEEFSIEEENGQVSGYLFVIKNKAGKKMDVQIDAKTGEVLSVEASVD